MTPAGRLAAAPRTASGALAVAVASWLAAPAEPAGAQMDSIRAVVELREQDYEVARNDYIAAYSSRSQLERQWNRLNNDLDIARDTLTRTETSEKLAQLQELSVQVERADGWAESRKDLFMDAGAALVVALEAQLDLLSGLIRTVPDTARARELGDLYRDRSNRVGQVEGEMDDVGERIPRALDPLPEIAVSPRDTPRQIMQKARRLDDEAEQHERLMGDLDAEIERLGKRLERDRATSDFFADPNRVGDMRLPVASGSSGDEAGGGELPWGEKTLEEKIEELVEFRQSVEAQRDQLRQKAAEFRAQAGGSA